MPEQDIEDAIHAHARATVAGDIGAAFRTMTPEGLATAMAVGNNTWNIASYEASSPSSSRSNEYASFIVNSRARITPNRGLISSRNFV